MCTVSIMRVSLFGGGGGTGGEMTIRQFPFEGRLSSLPQKFTCYETAFETV